MIKMVKEKLTLSVDKEVIEKAKKLGINISDITEQVLKGYTSAEKPEEGSLYDGYKQLFDSITPLLKEFGVSVAIAEDFFIDDRGFEYGPSDILLEPDGSFYSDLFDVSFRDIKKIELQTFLSPKKILANLVDALVKSKEAMMEKMKEILMAKRIIDAMTETLIEKRSPKAEMHSKDREKS